MKTVWKVLGLTALAVGLTPYRVTTDEETGDVKLRALLWKGAYGRRSGNHGLTLDVGFFPPNEEDEPHLYADELVVHYHNGQPCCVNEDEGCCGAEESSPAEAPAACCCQAEEAAPEAQPEAAPEADPDCQAPDAAAETAGETPEKLREP